MRQAVAKAHANLAFVKYWGKKDATLNIPANNSISMNLSGAQTTTTVTFDGALTEDVVWLDREEAGARFTERVSRHLDRVRWFAGVFDRVRVETHNSFPASAGFASSASGFAALTLAAMTALGFDLSERELSIWARLGSGSACRSVPGGFVEWHAGATSDDSYAEQIAPPEHWDIRDLAVVVSTRAKDVPSSQGHRLAASSPFWRARLEQLPARLERVRRAILEREFHSFGREIEAEALSVHAVMMTSAHEAAGGWHSGIYYWSPETLELLVAVQRWREDGLPVYFTLDAGPTVHLICPAENECEVMDAVKTVQNERDWPLLVSRPAAGCRIQPAG